MTDALALAPNMQLYLERRALLSVPSFSLPGPGTYTLEGPNGSGKSMFIRLLTGTLPGGLASNNAPGIQVNGKSTVFFSYRDALAAGVVAVFQDDDMISPMTVFENLLLRHGNVDRVEGRNYVWRTLYNLWIAPAHHKLQVLGPAVSRYAEKVFARIHPPAADWMTYDQIRQRSLELLRHHGVAASILDEVPPRLSGGGRAAARLVAAQLYKNTRILLLDEPFNSVERNIWPAFLDSIKAWAQEREAAVLAISHNPAELARWEPRVRFEIRDGVLAEAESFAFGRMRRIAPARFGPIPVFEQLSQKKTDRLAVWQSLWGRLNPETCVVLVEDWARNSPFVEDLTLNLPAGCKHYVVEIQGTATLTTTLSVESLSRRLSELSVEGRTVSVIVGGGHARTAGLLAGLNGLAANSVGTVVALTSFRDAVEAIVSSRVEISSSDRGQGTHRITVNANFFPDAFLWDSGFFAISKTDRWEGMMSCLRIGLLLDDELFEKCERTVDVLTVEPEILIDIFHRVLGAINETVDVDDGTFSFGRILHFGNDYARGIKEITNQEIANGDALLLGMIIEAILGGSAQVAERLQRLRIKKALRFPAELLDNSKWQAFEAAVRQRLGTSLKCLRVESPGDFNVNQIRRELTSSDPNLRGRYNRDVATFLASKLSMAIQTADSAKLHATLIQLDNSKE